MLSDETLIEFALAERLHKTHAEVLAMSTAEFFGWQLFFARQEKQ